MSTIQEHEQQALDAFQGNVAKLAQVELDRLEAERIQLEESLKIVRTALRSVRATLTASLPKQSKNGSKPKGKKQGDAASAPSPAAARMFAVWLSKQPGDRDLTAKMLFTSKGIGFSASYCNMLMKWGRDNRLLRLSGQSGSTKLYRKIG